MALFGLFNKKKKESLDKGLEKTKESVFKKLSRAIVGKSKVDDEVLDNLEEVLISSDVGVDTTLRIIERIEERVQRDKYVGTDELNRVLKEEIVDLLKENNSTDYDALTLPEGHGPYVIMVVGVNGVGKTTTIGKLAHKFKEAGKSVILGAADTFRAAAVDQLVIWAERVGVPIVKQGMGADPRAVLMACVIGGSCAYATPIGMPANTMVVGAGNYKFMDYVKAGMPLIVIATVVSMIILPIAFPFYP